MRVDIEPQWKRLANWYWDNAGGYEGVGMSIWEMLERDYGAIKVRQDINPRPQMIVRFPDEKSYTAFLLRWA